MTPKRSAKKQRKRMPRVDWQARYKAEFGLVEDAYRREKEAYQGWWKSRMELSRYRLICDWTCQRIEKLEKWKQDLDICSQHWMKTALHWHDKFHAGKEKMLKLEANDSEQFRVEHASSVLWKEIAEAWQRKCGALEQEKRILLETLFVVQAQNIMQGEDILRQREELIKLRGKPEERISCNR